MKPFLIFFLVIVIVTKAATGQISQNALIFNGTTNKVSLPLLPFFTTLNTNPFTIEAWIRNDDTTQFNFTTIFNTSDETGNTSQGLRITVNEGYLTFWQAGAGTGSTPMLLNNGLCHHIAIVRPTIGAAVIAYVDGIFYQLFTPGSLSSQILPSIGATNVTGIMNAPFKGAIKEVRVWSTGRTQSQILANANVVVPYNSPNLVYYWRLNEGTGSTINNYCVNTSGGTGNLNGTSNWSSSCFGCTLPVATITYNTPLNFCYPGNVVLNAPQGPAYIYQWKKNNVILANTSSSLYVATSGDYRVEITNLCGTVSSNTATVIVSHTPSANINPSGNFHVCNSVALSTPTVAGNSYQWKKNGANISGSISSAYTVTTTGSYTVRVTNVCSSSTTAVPVTVTVSNGIPSTPGSITTTGGSTKVCPGNVRTYSISSVTNATYYTWTAPQGGIIQSGQGTTSVTVLYNSGFTVTDTLRVKANNICGSSNIRKLTIVRNNPAKPAAISGANFGLCNVSGKPYSVVNVAGNIYNWFFSVPNTQVVTGQGSNAITANYASGFLSGVLNVTASNGCGVSAARTLSVYAKPSTPVSITGSAQVCVNQQNVPYSITPLSGATSYTWTSPTGATVSNGIVTANTITSNATSVLVDFAATSGNVRARGNNSCASGSYRSLAVTFNCRQSQEEPEEESISIYPNPFDEELVVDGEGFTEARIFDSQGRLVYHSLLDESIQTLKPELPDGVYMINLISESEIKTFRLVRVGNFGKN